MPLWWDRVVAPAAVTLAGAVLIGVVLLVGRDEPAPVTASGGPPGSVEPALSDKQQKRWHKVYKDMRDGDFKKAEDELNRLIQENPLDQEAHELLQKVREAQSAQ